MMNKGINLIDIKRENRGKILKLLHNNGPQSRKVIADFLGLTQAAVTIIVNDMKEENIIIEIGISDDLITRVGRKEVLIDINYERYLVVGVNIEYDQIIISVSNLKGNVIVKTIKAIDSISKLDETSIINIIHNELLNMLWKNKIKQEMILGIGIGIIGAVHNISVSNFKNKLESYINLPVVVDNNVKTLAMAELDLGLKVHEDVPILFIKYGPGLGSTIINSGKIIYGYNYKTGEIGHTIVDPTSKIKCRCGRNGCIESMISEKAIITKISSYFNETELPILYKNTDGDINRINMKMLDSIIESEPIVRLILEEAINYIALTIANTIITIDPKYLILFGDNFRLPNFYYLFNNRLKFYLGEECNINIRLSSLTKDDVNLGPIALALRQYFYNIGGLINKKG